MIEKIRHHMDDTVLMAYSTGSLPEAFNLIVAEHVSLCDSCRTKVEAYDAVGGEVLEQLAEETVGDACLKGTLELIDGGEIALPPVVNRAKGVLPKPVQNYVGGDLDSVKWKPVGMGVKQAILPTSKDATARLLYIPAGTAMPDHGHRGTEMTLVLKGAFQDSDGYFARGDVEIADSEMHHTPVADIHEDCICLAVTDAPLQFDSLIPRIAQRFLRI